MSNLQVVLTVSSHEKPIPYNAYLHEDHSNYGFMELKGAPEKVALVEEVKDIPCLQRFLHVLNANTSAFFSVGCDKSFHSDESGHWVRSYIEFAFNYVALVQDAQHYFYLFFQFHKCIEPFVSKSNVQFHWELEPAEFTAASCQGFSCSIWITTGVIPNAIEARQLWETAVNRLSDFLAGFAQPDGQCIYRAGA